MSKSLPTSRLNVFFKTLVFIIWYKNEVIPKFLLCKRCQCLIRAGSVALKDRTCSAIDTGCTVQYSVIDSECIVKYVFWTTAKRENHRRSDNDKCQWHHMHNACSVIGNSFTVHAMPLTLHAKCDHMHDWRIIRAALAQPVKGIAIKTNICGNCPIPPRAIKNEYLWELSYPTMGYQKRIFVGIVLSHHGLSVAISLKWEI
jgi:hypothetical protein